jgi:hypothetical protein
MLFETFLSDPAGTCRAYIDAYFASRADAVVQLPWVHNFVLGRSAYNDMTSYASSARRQGIAVVDVDPETKRETPEDALEPYANLELDTLVAICTVLQQEAAREAAAARTLAEVEVLIALINQQ